MMVRSARGNTALRRTSLSASALVSAAIHATAAGFITERDMRESGSGRSNQAAIPAPAMANTAWHSAAGRLGTDRSRHFKP